MIFTAPWGLLALIAVPAIIAIHLFKRRFPPRTVAGLFLWQMARQTPEGGGRIARLPITASLILECLAALALALILAGARSKPAAVNPHLIVLLDDSASMAAVNARNESPHDRVTARVLAELQRLGSTSRVTLVLSGERPSVLAGPSALAVEAQSALDRWKPAAPRHSLALGLRLAREIAGKTGRLLIATDTTPMERGEDEVSRAVWFAAGEPLGNAGIVAAERTRGVDGKNDSLALTLGNYTATALHRRLQVKAAMDGTVITAQDLDAPPGLSAIRVALPSGTGAVRAELDADALERDNTVTLVEPRPQIVMVENHLADGRGRQALVKALAGIAGAAAAEQGHLSFEPASALDGPPKPGVWRVAFGRAPGALSAAGEPKDFIGPFVPEKRHPLLDGVALAGVVWTGAAPLAASAHPLVSAGDQPLIALLGTRPEGGILFNIDLDRTNLIRAPDWPILISNLVEWRRVNLPGPERWNYRIGEWIRIRRGREPKGPLRFRAGAIERGLTPGRTIEFIAPPATGLLQILEGSDVLYELGVNFLDETQSNLSGKTTAELGKFNPEIQGQRAESGPASDPLFWILVVVGGIAFVGNWLMLGSAPRRAA